MEPHVRSGGTSSLVRGSYLSMHGAPYRRRRMTDAIHFRASALLQRSCTKISSSFDRSSTSLPSRILMSSFVAPLEATCALVKKQFGSRSKTDCLLLQPCCGSNFIMRSTPGNSHVPIPSRAPHAAALVRTTAQQSLDKSDATLGKHQSHA